MASLLQDMAKILQDNNGKSCPVLHISSCLQNVLCDRTQTGHCPESSLMMINESDPVYARRQHHPGPRPRYSLAAVNVGSYSHYGNPNTNAALTVKI